ncbi:MAG: hypothetical protein OJF47_002490 [Nitrospira sp.]|nr:MAG: hypothetical protein OJF47_002490 [Nitrospira sp.]
MFRINAKAATYSMRQRIRKHNHWLNLHRVANDNGAARSQECAYRSLRQCLAGLIHKQPAEAFRWQLAQHSVDRSKSCGDQWHYKEK